MPPRLTSVQRRVLGVLIEKSMTTPTGYPLTLNSVLTGCNQLSCREPVMELSEPEVAQALQELKKLKLAKEADYAPGSRGDRFQHAAQGEFGAEAASLALLAELLLRGPQTAGELKTNGSRVTA